MQKIMYGIQDIKDLCINSCHLGLCDRLQKKKCDRQQECLQQLCGDEERKIGKVSIFKSFSCWDKVSNKIEKAVDKWRKNTYKKCRPIKMVIERP